MEIREEITAYGHENIQCSHKSTIELTKEDHLTKKGNCILGINCSKACVDLNSEFKDIIRKGKKINVMIKVDDLKDQFYGYGDPNMTLLDEKDIVFRKSNFICNRTILIKCNKASCELDKKLIEKLRIPGKKIKILFRD
ncbi:MAG: DUF371 domain-containing protein [Candidatus Lokiarchaeota archaeon]|nr:DUF371 domain-containing protein [Candidatus Lokiarchaeota archaeon]